ncbi:hypothetical protein Daesc_006359 [Daldinia eschscholtzii]|uniref:Multiple myeloma tumor-associated protein 2-like N-terminal domain-containing protein n=1 Tax=Daldinia eschscholtzii TaxID=292717 RepID=A0AAX6MH57_9PEZI
MDLVSSIRKTGSRGGVNFNWEDVATSTHRENYLGHSLKAPVGRWAKGKDLTWYAKADASTSTETEQEKAARERKEELKRIKEAEEDALARALGLPVAPRNVTGANAVDIPNNHPTIPGRRPQSITTLGGTTEGGIGAEAAAERDIGTDHQGEGMATIVIDQGMKKMTGTTVIGGKEVPAPNGMTADTEDHTDGNIADPGVRRELSGGEMKKKVSDPDQETDGQGEVEALNTREGRVLQTIITLDDHKQNVHEL